MNTTDALSIHELDSGNTPHQRRETMLAVVIGIEFGWRVLSIHSAGSLTEGCGLFTTYVMGNINEGLNYPKVKVDDAINPTNPTHYIRDGATGIWVLVNDYLKAWRDYCRVGIRYSDDGNEMDLLHNYIQSGLIPPDKTTTYRHSRYGNDETITVVRRDK